MVIVINTSMYLNEICIEHFRLILECVPHSLGDNENTAVFYLFISNFLTINNMNPISSVERSASKVMLIFSPLFIDMPAYVKTGSSG